MSIIRAAEALKLTAPAVSMQIKELEAEVGLPAFDRTSRQVALTMIGIHVGAHPKVVPARAKPIRARFALSVTQTASAEAAEMATDSGANVITTDNSDWATNCPEYKVTAVQVTRVTRPSEWQMRYRSFSQRQEALLRQGSDVADVK